MINRINKAGAQSAKLPKPCKFCGSIGHSAFTCPKKPRKPLKATKRIRRVGKIGKKQLEFNKAWLASIPDNKLNCFYCKYLGRANLLERPYAQAEHFMSRARHPELRYDPNNLVVTCAPHNAQKGSRDGFEFLKILDKEKS